MKPIYRDTIHMPKDSFLVRGVGIKRQFRRWPGESCLNRIVPGAAGLLFVFLTFVISLLMALLVAGLTYSATSLAATANKSASSQQAVTPQTRPDDIFDVRDGQESSLVDPQPGITAALENVERQLTRVFGDVDPHTGTMRSLVRWDGALSGPGDGGDRESAMQWISDNLELVGIDKDDLDSLRFVDKDRSPDGVAHLNWEQVYRGVPAFDNSLSLTLDSENRVLSVAGSPLHDLEVESVAPSLSAEAAIERAAQLTNAPAAPDLRVASGPDGPTQQTTYTDGHSAQLVLFNRGDRMLLAWELSYDHPDPRLAFYTIIDGNSGQLLWQDNTIDTAQANVWEYFPRASSGGTARVVDLSPWRPNDSGLPQNQINLSSNNSAANLTLFADLNANGQNDGGAEQITRQGQDWVFLQRVFPQSTLPSSTECPAAGCSWAPGQSLTNVNQAAVQTFYFINRFADHLALPPISFSRSEFSRVSVRVFNGAGLPDPPSATGPAASVSCTNPKLGTLFFPLNANPNIYWADAADVVYHEYAHLVTNALSPALCAGNAQSNAMRETLSDWYAIDFLLKQGIIRDTAALGEIKLARYTDLGLNRIRSQPLDCTVGGDPGICPRNLSNPQLSGGGGYTYRHFGRIRLFRVGAAVVPGPQVHADGEILGETLFDLRRQMVAILGEQVEARRPRR